MLTAEVEYECMEKFTIVLSIIVLVLTFPVSIFFCIRLIHQYERGIVLRLGKARPPRKQGLIFVLPCTDTCYIIDMRVMTYDIPSQEVLTKDFVSVAVDAVLYYKVFDPLMAVVKIYNFTHATRFTGATMLRNVIGGHNMADVLQKRDVISKSLRDVLDDATDSWGIKIERVEIKNVALPLKLQRTMAAEAEAGREARAKVIAAQGELAAASALQQASAIIAESPAALQLRYLQTLVTVAGEKTSTIIFPLPVDLLTPFVKPAGGGGAPKTAPPVPPPPPIPELPLPAPATPTEIYPQYL